MSRPYVNTWKREAYGAAPGDQFDADFDAAEEAYLVRAGRVALVPVEYEVVGPRKVEGCGPGETFTHAFTVAQEASLIDAGHIARVEAAPKKRARKAADDE